MTINSSSTLAYVYSEHYMPGNLRITSDSTKKHYRITLKHMGDFLGREPLVSDLNDATCTRFVRWYHEVKEIAPATINQRMGYLKALWRWCSRERYVDKFPNFHKMPEPKPMSRAWTIDQLDTLFQACREVPGFIGSIPAGTWWVNVHRFAWESGERIGAILQARWDDTEPERGLIEIPAKYRKGKYHGMLYFVSKDLMAALVAMRMEGEPLIFPFPYTEATFYNKYGAILKRAGLPSDRRSKMHRIRRSFASHLEAAGGNATDAFHHSSRRITTDSYLDESIIQRTPAHKILPMLAKGVCDE